MMVRSRRLCAGSAKRAAIKVLMAASAAASVATPVAAEPITPADVSQHPRNGLLADLEFRRDSDELVWGAYRDLGRVAAWIEANPTGTLVIEGHASKRGSARHNLELSLRRANTVRRVLVEAGIPADRVIVAAYGERGIQRGHNRRVAIWSTREERDAALALVHARGASIVRGPGETATAVSRR